MARKILVGAGIAALSLLADRANRIREMDPRERQTDIEITAPDPAQPFQVCFDRVQGRAGLNTPDDPAVTPPPPGPYTPITVRVFAGPSGTLDGATVQGDGTLLLLDGTTLEPAATQVTSAPTAVDPPESYFGDFSETFLVWEYAAAPFDIAIPAGKSAPGDELVVQQGSHPAYVTLGAVACSSGPITARIDLRPGSTLNRVAPSDKRRRWSSGCTARRRWTSETSPTSSWGTPLPPRSRPASGSDSCPTTGTRTGTSTATSCSCRRPRGSRAARPR